MKRKVRKIAVIGFGSAGAATAIQLKREGFEVEVFERAPHIGPVGAGILLHPSGQLVLERLRLLEPVTTKSERIESIHVETRRGKTLLDIRYDEYTSGRAAYGVERPLLFAVLESAAVECGIPLTLNSEITAIESRPDGSYCKTISGTEEGPFDLVLVSDGARSKLRRSLVSWSHTWSYPHSARWVIGKCSAVQGRLFQIVDGTRRLVGVLPTGNGRASFFWGVAPGEEFADFPKWKDEALKICPHAAEIIEPLQSGNQMISAGYSHIFSSSCRPGNAILLGDAWHAMSPHLGQGTNLALLDGYLFAKSLSQADGALDDALLDFLPRRVSHNRLYAAMSFSFSPFFQSNGLIKGMLRDTFLPLIPRVPWLRRQMVASIGGLKHQILSDKDLDF